MCLCIPLCGIGFPYYARRFSEEKSSCSFKNEFFFFPFWVFCLCWFYVLLIFLLVNKFSNRSCRIWFVVYGGRKFEFIIVPQSWVECVMGMRYSVQSWFLCFYHFIFLVQYCNRFLSLWNWNICFFFGESEIGISCD